MSQTFVRVFNKYNTSIAISFLFISTILIMFYYKNGGTRDFGLYFKAGLAFSRGENAYITQEWRSGSLGSVFIWLISCAVPAALQVSYFQILSFFGFWSFASIFNKNKTTRLWTMGFLLFLSPIREVINTLQITGLVFGLLSLFMLKVRFRTSGGNLLFQLIQILALALAVNLKPHSLIFILLLLFLKGYKRDKIILSLISMIIGNIPINLKNGRILELDWFRELRQLGNPSGSTGESTSIWKLIDHISHSRVESNMLSIFIIFISLIVVAKVLKKISVNETIICGLLISTLLTYMHYYDLAPLAIIVLIGFLSKQMEYLGTLLIMFLILPREISQPNNLIIFCLLLILIVFVKSAEITHPQRKQKYFNYVLTGIVAFIFLHSFNRYIGFNYRMTHTLMTSESILMIWIYLILALRTKINICLDGLGVKKERGLS